MQSVAFGGAEFTNAGQAIATNLMVNSPDGVNTVVLGAFLWIFAFFKMVAYVFRLETVYRR